MRPSPSWRAPSAVVVALAAAFLGVTAASARPVSSPGRDAGEIVMTAIAPGPPPATVLAAVRRGEAGGVILTGNWSSPAEMTAATRSLQQAACTRSEPLLVAVDQEGGPIRRLPWAEPREAAQALGLLPAPRIETKARAAAAALKLAGVGVDFAPVADTRLSPRSFLGSRTFSSSASVVAADVAAFVRGLQAGGVAATAKHFPGLGAATLNTDDHVVSVRLVRLQPFRSAIAAGTKLVMVANASYPLLDPSGSPAVFSRTIVTKLLRGTLAFDGVVVTDALDAPTPAAMPHAPARALAAGVDLLLYTSSSSAARAYASLLHDAASSAALRARIAAAAQRVRALKAWIGTTCAGP